MKTTFSRTFSTAAIILMLALVLVGTSFQALVKDYLTDTTMDGLQKNAAAVSNLASAYHADGSLNNRQLLVNLDVISQVSNADTIICNANGRIILCSDTLEGCSHQGLHFNREYVDKVIKNGGDTAIGTIRDLYSESRYVVAAPILEPNGGSALGIVIVSRPLDSTTVVLDKISNIFSLVAVLVIFLAFIAMTFFARYQSNPLKELANAARSFGHGDLDARVKLEGDHPEEVEDLALAFNNMAMELQKSEYQRQEFVANVSHELKTPMTTISGYIDGILDGTIPQHRQRYYLQIVSDETKRLSRLVRSMLDISRLQDQSGIPEEKKHQFDLEEAAGQVLITFEQKINAKKLEVDVDMPEHPVYTFANQDYVTQVLYNLLDNAVKFCPQEGTLGLKIKEGGSKAYISVSNSGDTIPPEELPLVFDRFHKLDKSRSQNRDGWGLGLYIVKTIVCSHGENISVTSRDGKTEFTFTMPLVN
ncbi:MAG: HAMP domain-containing histidine kinase [Oscillospiraceae bacterium]|nr:HAMP domain-containing histidine kinase [Oscillospiraceae bacterium]